VHHAGHVPHNTRTARRALLASPYGILSPCSAIRTPAKTSCGWAFTFLVFASLHLPTTLSAHIRCCYNECTAADILLGAPLTPPPSTTRTHLQRRPSHCLPMRHAQLCSSRACAVTARCQGAILGAGAILQPLHLPTCLQQRTRLPWTLPFCPACAASRILAHSRFRATARSTAFSFRPYRDGDSAVPLTLACGIAHHTFPDVLRAACRPPALRGTSSTGHALRDNGGTEQGLGFTFSQQRMGHHDISVPTSPLLLSPTRAYFVSIFVCIQRYPHLALAVHHRLVQRDGPSGWVAAALSAVPHAPAHATTDADTSAIRDVTSRYL